MSESNERSTYIIKPAPWDETIATRKQIPANEHVTMQIARQVYGIVTAENGLCFTKDGQTVYITKRFDILPGWLTCRLDFERFGTQIGLADARIKRVLDKYMQVPELTTKLVGNSFLNDKMKRTYLRIVDERVKRFIRDSE